MEYVFQFEAYKELTSEGLKLDYSKADIYAENEKEALKKLKQLLTKEVYELVAVLERPAPHPDRKPYIFVIHGYDGVLPETRQFISPVTIEVFDDNSASALDRAMKLVHKKLYRVHTIVEKKPSEL